MTNIVLLDVKGHVLDHTRYLKSVQYISTVETYYTRCDISDSKQFTIQQVLYKSLGVHDTNTRGYFVR